MTSDYNDFVDEFENYPDVYQQYDPRMGGAMDDVSGSFMTQEIPEDVKKYLIFFRDVIRDMQVFQIPMVYAEFARFTDTYYQKEMWPDINDLIANKIIEDDVDEVFQILYSELFYRHIYARVTNHLTLDHRFDSYFNYCKFFNFILSASTPTKLELPHHWLWEIIDEFIYQFQSFSQYRAKLGKKTDDELVVLRENQKMWNVHSVLNVLHCLIDKSNINEQLKVYTNGGDPDSVAGEFGRHSLYKMLGYFSLVGLCRLHSLLGDYHQALLVLENIELNKKSMYSRVASCQITTYYYVGFAYMMMRRYADAIRTFSNILVYIQRTRGLYSVRTYQTDQINKQTDQMYHLLSICLVLHPQRIDEAIQSTLREKALAEKISRMTRGDIAEFTNCFTFACPKFLSPIPPPFDAAPGNYLKEAFQQQLKVFLDEVQQQMQIGIIRSYLKLYTTMPVEKMAAFTEMNSQDFCNSLLCFKHKMMNEVWTKGTSGLTGEFQIDSEVDFFIDKQMIHIADTKVAQRYGDFFIRQIHKLEDVSKGLSKVKI